MISLTPPFHYLKKVLLLHHGIVKSDIPYISWFWIITLLTYHGIYTILKVLQTIPWYYRSATSKKIPHEIMKILQEDCLCCPIHNIFSHLMGMEWFLQFYYLCRKAKCHVLVHYPALLLKVCTIRLLTCAFLCVLCVCVNGWVRTYRLWCQ